jgi:hypothetical protein
MGFCPCIFLGFLVAMIDIVIQVSVILAVLWQVVLVAVILIWQILVFHLYPSIV